MSAPKRTIAGVPLVATETLPGLRQWVPADPDAVVDHFLDTLDEAAFEATDERLPYYANVWPAALALAKRILEGPPLQGQRWLDLGCGLGTCALAAAQRGAEVHAADWDPPALEILRATASDFGHALHTTAVVDWRSPPPLPLFTAITGADLLYEARNHAPVATFLHQHLQPQGKAWLSDPDRRIADPFPTVAAQAQLHCSASTLPHPNYPGGQHHIRLFHLAHRSP